MQGWFKERFSGIHAAITPKQVSAAVILASVLTVTIRAWDQVSGFLAGQGVSAMGTVPSILVGLLVLMFAVAWFLLEHIVKLTRLLAPKFALSFDRVGGTGVVAAIERITSPGAGGVIYVSHFNAAYVRVRAEA